MSTLEEFEKLNLSIKIMKKEIKKYNKDEASYLKSKLEDLLSSKKFSEKVKIYYKLNLKNIDKIDSKNNSCFCFSFSYNTTVFKYYPDKHCMGIISLW